MTARRTYLVEAWRGLECVAFRRVSRASTVRSTADHYIADLGADRLYVRGEGEVRGLLADWAQGPGWRRIDDRALEEALTGDEA